MNKIHKRLLSDIKKIAAHFPLSLSKTDVMKKRALGLDQKAGKLIYLDDRVHPYFMLIDLNKTASCSINMSYKNISAGDLEDKKVDDFTEKIFLRLHRKDDLKPVDIQFYDHKENQKHEVSHMMDLAGRWKKAISNLLSPTNTSVAALNIQS